MAAMLLTRPMNHEYFAGVHTEFWASPTRSYLLIVPSSGKMTAIVPSVAAFLWTDSPAVGTVHKMLGMELSEADFEVIGSELKNLGNSTGKTKFGAELGHEFA